MAGEHGLCRDCSRPLPKPTGRGRPPVRCEECRARPRPGHLTSVPDPETPATPAAKAGRVLPALQQALDGQMSDHPHADALEAIAMVLGATLDDPETRLDARLAATASKELRAVLADLAGPRGGGGEDPDGDSPFGDLSPQLGDSQTG